uniref:Uncharacterized protein n=1 Tax=viral metagenome TaxID=1070528 RepID=A0A6H2A571_9ZZZZ
MTAESNKYKYQRPPKAIKYPRRKYRIGQWVRTKSGQVGKVVASGIFGMEDGKVTQWTIIEYRIKVPGVSGWVHNRETELSKAAPPKR